MTIENYLKERFQADEKLIKCCAGLAQGSLGRAIQLAKRGGDPVRQMILPFLSQGKLKDFKGITQVCGKLVEEIEANRKLLEEESKEYYANFKEYATAAQQSSIEKELEGLSAVAYMQETDALFQAILSWYRDLHLLSVNGPRQLMMNADFEIALDQSFQRGEILSLELIQKAIQEAKLALQRSVSLNICLENLFLKLA